MTDPTLFIQRALGTALVGSSDVLALVPAANIADARFDSTRVPSILLGEATIAPAGFTLRRAHHRVYATLHIWAREPGLVSVKRIAGAVASTLRSTDWTADDYRVFDFEIEGARYLRDPDGVHSHAVVSAAFVVEDAA